MKKTLSMLHIKLIGFACIVMLNFAWSGIVQNNILKGVLGFIGSAGITLFLFAMNEGMKHTSSLNKYMIRVLVLAVLSGFPYYAIYHNFASDSLQVGSYLSSPFTVFFCMGAIVLYDRIQYKKIRIFSIFFCVLVSWFFGVEWAPYAVILAYMIHLCDDRPNYRDYNIIMFFVVIALVSAVFMISGAGDKNELIKNISLLGAVLALPVIRMYNGERGSSDKSAKLVKWSFYMLYPVLLCIIMVVKLVIIKNI